MDIETRGRRGGGGRRRGGSSVPVRVTAYHQLRHPFSPQSVFSDDEVAAIHETALRVLEELGIRILLPEAREILSQAGARVQDDMVFIGRDIVAAALASAPASIRLRAANPAREQVYETGALLFSPGSGCPNVTDMDRGRRPGSLQSYEETLKLHQSFDVIHMLGPSAEPQDIPPHLRHYAMMRGQIALSDKPMFIYARGRAQIEQSLDMIRIAHALTDADFATGVWGVTVINSNSPRVLDNPMAQGIVDFARAGQMPIITPFCLAGAMAPVTVAGALTLQHAEALACIALSQMTRAGAPVSYGGFSSNVDMKSGAPAFGTPEHLKMQIGSGQLARHIGLPWRSAAGSAANLADVQGATENIMGLWGLLMGNATLGVHSAGWLEGGLSFGYEKFITDVEALQTLAELCVKPSGATSEIGYDAIAEVRPSGHFFAAAHTMERYSTAFYVPLISDLSNFGTWQAAGAKSATDRAHEIWKQTLADYAPPPGADEAADRIDDYIARNSAAGGAPPLE